MYLIPFSLSAVRQGYMKNAPVWIIWIYGYGLVNISINLLMGFPLTVLINNL